MKTVLLLIAATLLTISSEAQWSYKFLSQEKHFLYTSGDFIVGKQTSGQISLNYVYNNKYTVNVGFSATTKSETMLPDHILKSATQMIPLNSATPFNNSENMHVMVGRVFKLSHDGSVRLLLQAGPGLYTSRDPVFSVKSNAYDFDIEANSSLCLVANPKIELPLFSTIGFSAGPMVMVNENQHYIGAGIGLMYGIVGKD